MKPGLRSAKIAGLLSFLAAGLASVPWFMLLFVGNPPNRPLEQTVLEQLTYVLSPENSVRWLFISNAALPVLSAAIGVAYLGRVTESRHWTIVLLCLNLLLAGAALIVANWPIALFVALPALLGWQSIHAA
jgi:hypothetical protein